MNIEKFIEQILYLIKESELVDMEKYMPQILSLIKNMIEKIDLVPEEGTIKYAYLLIMGAFSVIGFLGKIVESCAEIPDELQPVLPDFLQNISSKSLKEIFFPESNYKLYSDLNSDFYSQFKDLPNFIYNDYAEQVARHANRDFIVNPLLFLSFTEDLAANGVDGNVVDDVITIAEQIIARNTSPNNPHMIAFADFSEIPINMNPATVAILPPGEVLIVFDSLNINYLDRMANIRGAIPREGNFNLMLLNTEFVNDIPSPLRINDLGNPDDIDRLTTIRDTLVRVIEDNNRIIHAQRDILLMQQAMGMNVGEIESLIERIEFANRIRIRLAFIIDEIINIIGSRI